MVRGFVLTGTCSNGKMLASKAMRCGFESCSPCQILMFPPHQLISIVGQEGKMEIEMTILVIEGALIYLAAGCLMAVFMLRVPPRRREDVYKAGG